MAHDLTARQAQILTFIADHIRDRGYPPTLREIGRAHGIKSTNGVCDHLLALERKGYIRRDGESIARSLIVLKPTHEPPPEEPKQLNGATVSLPVFADVGTPREQVVDVVRIDARWLDRTTRQPDSPTSPS